MSIFIERRRPAFTPDMLARVGLAWAMIAALLLVRDHLVVAHVVPVVIVHLYLHPWSRRILYHVALAYAYQSIDVKPRVAEY